MWTGVLCIATKKCSIQTLIVKGTFGFLQSRGGNNNYLSPFLSSSFIDRVECAFERLKDASMGSNLWEKKSHRSFWKVRNQYRKGKGKNSDDIN